MDSEAVLGPHVGLRTPPQDPGRAFDPPALPFGNRASGNGESAMHGQHALWSTATNDVPSLRGELPLLSSLCSVSPGFPTVCA